MVTAGAKPRTSRPTADGALTGQEAPVPAAPAAHPGADGRTAVATGSRARAVLDFANGVTGDLPAGQRPAAFGAFVTGLRLGVALALADAAWAWAADAELAVGLGDDLQEQHFQTLYGIAQIRRRADAYHRHAATARRRAPTGNGRTASAGSAPSEPSSPVKRR